MTHLLIADLKSCQSNLDQMFRESLNINYAELCHREFEKTLSRKAKRLVEESNSYLRPIDFSEESTNETDSAVVDDNADSDIALGTRLFELYLALQKFYDMSSLPENPRNNIIGNGSDSGAESNSGSEKSQCDGVHANKRYHR